MEAYHNLNSGNMKRNIGQALPCPAGHNEPFQCMSVDQTISELSSTLAQLSTLVAHINGQINGITSRINLTLDNFDKAVANIAKDAGSVTYQVGDSVSQVPNSWVFYMLFITLIVVFILLSVVLILNLITKIHAIVRIVNNKDGTERALISVKDDTSRHDNPTMPPYMPFSQNPRYSSSANDVQNHVSISMEHEPRRVGMPSARRDSIDVETRPYQRRLDETMRFGGVDSSSQYTRSLEV
ncbi:hypothetical protein KIN20_004917 [Parelaphostrongylus tenuis]|uniref:Uncharacterized protein n=1 Tax=Parelaphostrongylus tenuis TaxID=148309 RepID=A0AAD5QFJ8_PARTN|nr:hypothetical protein KIN20_004917 [Parelaphostrongylus tenuis]